MAGCFYCACNTAFPFYILLSDYVGLRLKKATKKPRMQTDPPKIFQKTAPAHLPGNSLRTSFPQHPFSPILKAMLLL